MRVLLYHPEPAWGGTARVLDAAARGLAARGWEVTFVCAHDSAVEERVASAGYEVVPAAGDGGRMAEAIRLRRVLDARFAEVVFVHTPREHLIAAGAMRLAERGAIVRRFRAGEPFTSAPASRFAARLATTDFCFTTPNELRTAPAPRLGAHPPALVEVGVDPTLHDAIRPASRTTIGATQDGRLLACVYDPDGRDRARTVLRTLALLSRRHPDLRLALVGPGSDDEELRMHAAALGITPLVAHLGERDDMLAVLRAADLGWVVASGDNAAYGYLDFMALRVPVLADRTATAAHYVADGITGVLVPPGDHMAVAATVATLLGHEDQRAAMGAAGRGRVAREFTEGAMVDGFERAATSARDRTRWRL